MSQLAQFKLKGDSVTLSMTTECTYQVVSIINGHKQTVTCSTLLQASKWFDLYKYDMGDK